MGCCANPVVPNDHATRIVVALGNGIGLTRLFELLLKIHPRNADAFVLHLKEWISTLYGNSIVANDNILVCGRFLVSF